MLAESSGVGTRGGSGGAGVGGRGIGLVPRSVAVTTLKGVGAFNGETSC